MSVWTDFITTQPLTHTAATPLLAHCDHLSVIRASGEEAGHYLQGQVSCDLSAVDQGAHRNGMHLSLKGRGLVSVRLVRQGDDYLLLCPNGMEETVIKALCKYRLHAKVDFTVDHELIVLGLAGALDQVQTQLGELPPAGEYRHNERAIVLRYPYTEQLLMLVPEQHAESLWADVQDNRALTGANGWQYQDILAGEGHVFPGGEDRFMPQGLNYDVIGGVSFNKGCYTGQEVVARMHFKGKMKQRMQRITYQADRQLQPGDTLRDDNGKAAGEIVVSARGEDHHAALALLRRAPAKELFHEETALQASVATLPYTLPWKD